MCYMVCVLNVNVSVLLHFCFMCFGAFYFSFQYRIKPVFEEIRRAFPNATCKLLHLNSIPLSVPNLNTTDEWSSLIISGFPPPIGESNTQQVTDNIYHSIVLNVNVIHFRLCVAISIRPTMCCSKLTSMVTW